MKSLTQRRNVATVKQTVAYCVATLRRCVRKLYE